MRDEVDARRTLTASPLDDRRPQGCPRVMWFKNIQQDLKSTHLCLNEAINMAQNWQLRRHCCLRLALRTPSGAYWKKMATKRREIVGHQQMTKTVQPPHAAAFYKPSAPPVTTRWCVSVLAQGWGLPTCAVSSRCPVCFSSLVHQSAPILTHTHGLAAGKVRAVSCVHSIGRQYSVISIIVNLVSSLTSPHFLKVPSISSIPLGNTVTLFQLTALLCSSVHMRIVFTER